MSGPRTTVGGVSVVIAVRPALCEQVSGCPTPIQSFAPVLGGWLPKPATQHDAWLWIAGSARDVVFDSTLTAIRALALRRAEPGSALDENDVPRYCCISLSWGAAASWSEP